MEYFKISNTKKKVKLLKKSKGSTNLKYCLFLLLLALSLSKKHCYKAPKST